MACGTGKTLVGVWIAERLKSVRTLVLMPSLSLVNQVSREWQANSKEPFRALFVCSDQTVANDNFVSSTGDHRCLQRIRGGTEGGPSHQGFHIFSGGI